MGFKRLLEAGGATVYPAKSVNFFWGFVSIYEALPLTMLMTVLFRAQSEIEQHLDTLTHILIEPNKVKVKVLENWQLHVYFNDVAHSLCT